MCVWMLCSLPPHRMPPLTPRYPSHRPFYSPCYTLLRRHHHLKSKKKTKAQSTTKTHSKPKGKPAAKEFVFDPSSNGCAQVVTKRTAGALRKRRQHAKQEALLRKEVSSRKTDQQLKAEAKAAREAETLDRNEVWRSIRALSASQLKGWKLREWQEQQRRELGAKASKNRKMPLKMRMGIMKKRKLLGKKEQQRNRESGVVTASHKGNKAKKARRQNDASGRDIGNGGVRDGVMNVRFLLQK